MSKVKKLGRQGKTIFRKDGKVHRGIEDEGVDWSRRRIEDVQRRIEEDELIREKCKQRKDEDVEINKVGEKKMMELTRMEKNREFRMRREMMRSEQNQMQNKEKNKTLENGIFSVGKSAVFLSDHLVNQTEAHSQTSIAKRRLEEELKLIEENPEHNKKEETKTLEKLRVESNKEFRMRREQIKLEKHQTKDIASGLFLVGNSAMFLNKSLSDKTKPTKPNNSPNLGIFNPNTTIIKDGKEDKLERKGKEEKIKKENKRDKEESGGFRDWLEEFAVWYFKICCCV